MNGKISKFSGSQIEIEFTGEYSTFPGFICGLTLNRVCTLEDVVKDACELENCDWDELKREIISFRHEMPMLFFGDPSQLSEKDIESIINCVFVFSEPVGLVRMFYKEGRVDWEGFAACRDCNASEDAKVAFLIHHAWNELVFIEQYKRIGIKGFLTNHSKQDIETFRYDYIALDNTIGINGAICREYNDPCKVGYVIAYLPNKVIISEKGMRFINRLFDRKCYDENNCKQPFIGQEVLENLPNEFIEYGVSVDGWKKLKNILDVFESESPSHAIDDDYEREIEDWGESLDDKDGSDWEDLFGGPDDDQSERAIIELAESYEEELCLDEEYGYSDENDFLPRTMDDMENEPFECSCRQDNIVERLSLSKYANQLQNGLGFYITNSSQVTLKDSSSIYLLEWLRHEVILDRRVINNYRIEYYRPDSKGGERLMFKLIKRD